MLNQICSKYYLKKNHLQIVFHWALNKKFQMLDIQFS